SRVHNCMVTMRIAAALSPSYLPSLFFFSLSCAGTHRDLHSFPTRRSSDLESPLEMRAVLSAAMECSLSMRSQSARLVLFLARFRSEEHTSELQSRFDLVCRLLLEKKNASVLLHRSRPLGIMLVKLLTWASP